MPTHAAPSKHVAVVTCMDARIEPLSVLGYDIGDVHVIRNAGAVVTDDVIRSVATSQRLLGTTEVVLMAHTACGLASADDATMRAALEGEGGVAWTADTHVFTDPADHVRHGRDLLVASPYVPLTDKIRCVVYDVETGGLVEVS